MKQGYVQEENFTLPMLAEVDALAIGGTLAGCIAAHSLALRGYSTLLVSSYTSIPYEMAVCRRAWLKSEALEQVPVTFKQAFLRCVSHAIGEKVILNLARLSIEIEDILLNAGVRLFYGMVPCGVVQSSSRSLSGVVFGAKSGLCAIGAKAIVDCTNTAEVARCAGLPMEWRRHVESGVRVHIHAKVGVVSGHAPLVEDRGQRNTCPTEWPKETALDVPGMPDLESGMVLLHGPYAEFIFTLPVEMNNPFWRGQLSNLARMRLVYACARIKEVREARGLPTLYFHRFSGGLLTDPLFRLSAAHRSKPWRPRDLDNLWVLGPAADLEEEEALLASRPCSYARAAQSIARRIAIGTIPRIPGPKAVLNVMQAEGVTPKPARFGFCEASQLHSTGQALKSDTPLLPVVEKCDVLVVGGGTSGVPAALAAAQAGAQTVLLEQNADVGGVRTVGGVGSYWFGRETSFQRECDRKYDASSERSGVAEEIAMLDCLLHGGVKVITHCHVIGVVSGPGHLKGVIVITDEGLGVVVGKVLVDATGDADVAAWAGVPCVYGNGRDAWTMWASFANFNAEKRTASRQYDSAIEIRDAHDIARTIITGRRRQGMWRRLAHEMPQLYVAPRESRRIKGRATVTYRGILAGETFPDVMTVCEANFDIKGLATSDMICCGVIWGWRARKLYPAAIPYRAILPGEIENLLVIGRAYSASHDALALARMQRDMVSMGGSAGFAAAMAVKAGIPPAQLRASMLQNEWLQRGTLLKKDLRRFGKPSRPYTREDAERDVRELLGSTGRRQECLARLMSSTESIGPLREAFRGMENRALKVKIARALCYLGDRSTVRFLLQVIEEQVANGLPRPYRPCLAVPPEHGWAPDPAYSLYAIGLAGAGAGAAHIMAEIAEKIDDNPERFASKSDSQFEYVRAICAVAERNPCPELLGPLRIFGSKSCLNNLVVSYLDDVRSAVDPVLERRSYLELCIGRALARCGDPAGYSILTGYLDDIRGPLARSAGIELRDILQENRADPTSQEIPKGIENKARLVPFAERID